MHRVKCAIVEEPPDYEMLHCFGSGSIASCFSFQGVRLHSTLGGGNLVTKSCPTLVTPWNVAHQTTLSMGFPRHKYRSGLLFHSPGDISDPGIKARSPALQADSLLTEP